MQRWIARIVLFLPASLLVFAPGCASHKLETGYEYTPIGSPSSAQRKAYFANPFSPEARAAQMETATEGYNRANRSGY
ncbi:MAG: hypothetical protein QM770_02945 [Tepidisphaeraceae bacterium]